MNGQTAAVILAAGEGTRMKAGTAKVLCEVATKPMIDWVVDSALQAGVSRVCVITGAHAEEVENHLSARYGDRVVFARQLERLGTGHAVRYAEPFLKQFQPENVAVLCGDAPFVSSAVLQDSLAEHMAKANAMTLLTAALDDPFGYGRVVGTDGALSIVEEKDATDAQRAVKDVNSGAYWFETNALLAALPEIGNDNAKGEYYLTDAAGILTAAGRRVGAFRTADSDCVKGANDRLGLLTLNELYIRRRVDALARDGVEFVLRDGIVISPDAVVEPGAHILPGTIIRGRSVVKAGAVIGPNSILDNTVIGENAVIESTKCTDSTVGPGAKIGPFSQLRPNSHVGAGVKIGDFVEVKNSTIGDRTSVAHLTYVGDSDVGGGVNFGCGVVTVNYDGKQKARCKIGDNAFIGCNTNLIAPVSVGEGAYTAAGTTITEDVPDGALAIGRARQTVKENWANEHIGFKRK